MKKGNKANQYIIAQFLLKRQECVKIKKEPGSNIFRFLGNLIGIKNLRLFCPMLGQPECGRGAQ